MTLLARFFFLPPLLDPASDQNVSLLPHSDTEAPEPLADLPCLQCGHCCGPYFSLYVEEDDEERWEREGRQDLLQRLEAERDAVDWDEAGPFNRLDGRRFETCVFLLEDPDGRRLCAIHPTKPRICRAFPPGSSELCILHPKKRTITRPFRFAPPTPK